MHNARRSVSLSLLQWSVACYRVGTLDRRGGLDSVRASTESESQCAVAVEKPAVHCTACTTISLVYCMMTCSTFRVYERHSVWFHSWTDVTCLVRYSTLPCTPASVPPSNYPGSWPATPTPRSAIALLTYTASRSVRCVLVDRKLEVLRDAKSRDNVTFPVSRHVEIT